jgi:rubrerythrin
METVCYTLEGALEKAIEQEQQSIEMYREALKRLENPRPERSKDLVRRN